MNPEFGNLEQSPVDAPTRATTFPADATGRKAHPVASGVLDYFPDALVAIAHVSWTGNEQHNPGTPLHWDRSKSGDEADALQRHFLERGTRDKDGLRHSAKMAWRALALLQKEIEGEQQGVVLGGAGRTAQSADPRATDGLRSSTTGGDPGSLSSGDRTIGSVRP